MLRRFALGYASVFVSAVIITGCSSAGAGQAISVGPSFAPETLYAANSTQNAINIYPLGATSGGPQYQIGGSLTALTGPQYLAFDSSGDLFVTNYTTSVGAGLILEFKALATGNVQYYNSLSFGTAHPRGIADFQQFVYGSTTSTDALAVGVVDPTQPLNFASRLEVFTASTVNNGAEEIIAGPATGLNVPSGVAVDSKNNVYVANLQGASITVYPMASPTATPSPSPTPSITPTPVASPTPTVSPTATPLPTVAPTGTPNNTTPIAVISGASTGIGQPTGVAIDSAGNIYVSDQASTICAPALAKCAAILVFPPGSSGNVAPKYIAGNATLLLAPTDVKVDNSGRIYVADSTATGAGVIYVFASGATGNVPPASTLTSPGAVFGIGLVP
jgi:hypothetical protein